MTNTTVTIEYSSGAIREFVASDELEHLISEGQMFSVTTMHSDISIDEEKSVSKMYVGNPIAALGNMMIMKRNAEKLEDKNKGVIIDVVNGCIGLLSAEITSHQSGMVNNCKICNKPLDALDTYGGDCLECMAETDSLWEGG